MRRRSIPNSWFVQRDRTDHSNACNLPDIIAACPRNSWARQAFRSPGGGRAGSVRPRRRILYAARAQRRGQDDHVAHGDRPAQARSRIDHCLRYRRAGRSHRRQADHGLGLGRADDLRQADADGVSRLRRRAVGGRQRSRRGAGARSAQPGSVWRRMPRNAASGCPRACARRWRWPGRWCTSRS